MVWPVLGARRGRRGGTSTCSPSPTACSGSCARPYCIWRRGLDAAERMGVADALRAARDMPRRLVYVGADGRERSAIDTRSIARLVGERQFNFRRGDIERALYQRVR